jgi:hypothetical protein
VPGSTGADLNYVRTFRTVTTQAFCKAVSPAGPIEIVAGGVAIRSNQDGVDGAGLHGRRVHGIEQHDNVLLERIGNIGAGKARGFDRGEELRQGAPRQPVHVHQMVEAIDPGRFESVGE